MRCETTYAVRSFLVWGIISLAAVSSAAGPASKLDKRYQEWLNGPPSLLITRTERSVFLNLATDADRDAFMERFWETRNPAPGSGENTFKEEFYRRVAWANAHFGPNSGTVDGWRTDMGKTWVLFGKPQFSRDYSQDPQLKPIQLWFYANPGLNELPSFFYVLFFDRDDVSGYRLYHPYVDGPQRLVRSGPTPQQAYQAMRDISAELAHASLSLIPGEPVDTDNFSGSMASGQIINAIQGYREMPSYVALISARAARLEHVTTHISYDLPQASLLAFVASQQGEPWLHWQLEVNDPVHPKAVNGRVAYRVESRLFARGQLVFERTDTPAFPAPAGPEDALNKRPFIYEDRMAVVPGSYRLQVTAQHQPDGRVYEAVKDFVVPESDEPIALSDVLVVSGRDRDPRPRPFAFGGVKFAPAAGGFTRSSRGLSILYQVRLTGARPAELPVEYVIGNPATKFRKSFEDKLDPQQADTHGALIVAKTLGLEDVAPGTYQLVVRFKDPQTGRLTARPARFVVTSEDQTPPIVVSRGGLDTQAWVASNDYERALCWLAQDRPVQAIPLLEASWTSSRSPAVFGLLQHLYEQTGQRSRLSSISKQTEGNQ